MSSPWSKTLDVDRLADDAAEVDFAGPVAELPALRELRGVVGGSVHGKVRFARARGLATAELVLSGAATLECQRCLRTFAHPVDAGTRVAFVGSEAESARVPEPFEPVLAQGARLGVGELVAQELLLTLPIVPLHPGDADCAGAAAGATAGAAAPVDTGTHRPLARLGELWGRDVGKDRSRS